VCFESIRPENVFRCRGKGGILIDGRTNEEYGTGHIPGAVNIPYEEIPKRIEEIRQLTRPQMSGRSAFLILYCEHGNTSMKASRDLYRLGFSVKNVFGGLHEYHGPLVKTAEQSHR